MRPNIFVPDPEPEEMLHSVLISAWRLSAYQSFPQFTKTLFKRASDGRGWSWDYRRICSYLDPCRATGWALLHKMLLMPYLLPFMPPEIARKAPRRLDGDRRIGGGDTNLTWGASTTRPLRYCPRCVQIQMTRLHRSIWLRPHQLDRVEVCWRHSVDLVSVMPHRTTPFFPHECKDQSITYSFDTSAIWLARQSQELLAGNHPPGDTRIRQHVYQERAARIGYGQGRKIDFRLIAVHLLQTFGPRYFQRLMGTCEVQDIAYYMRLTIFGDDPSIRPINQIFCIHALFGEQRLFFDRIREAGSPSSRKESDIARRTGTAQSTVHRNIFLEQLKTGGPDVMAHLAREYPLTRDWILQHALSWSRRKIAEQIQGPDRARILRHRAADLLAKAAREREQLRRNMSVDGGPSFDSAVPIDPLRTGNTVHGDFLEIASQLRGFPQRSLHPPGQSIGETSPDSDETQIGRVAPQ